MKSRAVVVAALATSVLAVASCRRDGAATSEGASPSDSAAAVANPPNSGAFAAHRPAELDSAARETIAFLRGEAGFDRIRVADTVALYVSPEGGGTRTVMRREQLRERSNWKVGGRRGFTYSLTPPAGLTKLTTRVGRHINCLEYSLSSRFPELARLPHVGTKLEPADGESCLQTRNLTLVFDPDLRPPTLVAVVHDQWEW